MGQLGRGRAVRSRFLQNLRLDDGRVEVKVVVEVVGRPRYQNQCRTKKGSFLKFEAGRLSSRGPDLEGGSKKMSSKTLTTVEVRRVVEGAGDPRVKRTVPSERKSSKVQAGGIPSRSRGFKGKTYFLSGKV